MTDSVGRQLARARNSLGRSLAEAEAVTRIRLKNLQALENGDYDRFPEAAYLRGYVIAYAKYLELDPAPLLVRLDQEISLPDVSETRVRRPSVSVGDKDTKISLRVIVVSVLLLASIASIAYAIGRGLFTEPQSLTPLPATPESTATPAFEPPNFSATTPSVVPTGATPPLKVGPEALEGEFTLGISIVSGASSWLLVTIDDLVAYEGILLSEQSKEWLVTERATIRIGRPSAVRISKNGRAVEITGGSGVAEIVLEP